MYKHCDECSGMAFFGINNVNGVKILIRCIGYNKRDKGYDKQILNYRKTFAV